MTVYTGGTGNDQLKGGSGNDQIYGGAGNDTLYGGATGDPSPQYVSVNGASQSVTGTSGHANFTASTTSSDAELTSLSFYGVTGNWIGNGDSVETHTHTMSSQVSGGRVYFNAIDTTDIVTIMLDGATVNLSTAIANGSISFNGGANYAINGAGQIVGISGGDALATGSFTINVPFTTFGISNAGSGNGTVYDLQVNTNAVGLVAASGDDAIYGGDGNDVIETLNGNDTVDGGAGNDRINGAGGNESLAGGTGDDSIYGGAGADTIDGGTGNDVVYGGSGNDQVTLGDGNDFFGVGSADESGNDTIYGGLGADSINAGTGDDRVYGGEGADTINAGTGNDVVFAGSGNDSVQLGDGNDVFGDWSMDDSGDDTIDGGLGNDSIIAGSGNDIVYGGDGDDWLSGQDGNDQLFGGAGNDLFAITDDHNGDTIYGGENSGDMDAVSFGTYASTKGVNVTFNGSEAGSYAFRGTNGSGSFSQIEAVYGTNYADSIDGGANISSATLAGAAGDDTITGGSGNELISGGGDQDVIRAGGGADVVFGESGNDILYAGSGADAVYGGNGNDYLEGESGDDTLEGDAGDDILHGGEGSDQSYGGEGDDILYSSVGDDTLDGGSGNDTFVIGDGSDHEQVFGGEDGEETDTLAFYSKTQGVTVTFKGNEDGYYKQEAENGFSGEFSAIERVTGTILDDGVDASSTDSGVSVEGNGGNDVLTGGKGTDQLYGGDGDDRLFGGDAEDYLAGGDGDDVLRGGGGVDKLEGGKGHDSFQLEAADSGDEIVDFEMSSDEEGATIDRLDVSDLTDAKGNPVKAWDVKVEDREGSTALHFPSGEFVILVGVNFKEVLQPGMLAAMGVPCFAAGTRIATPSGARRVEDIAPGDMVLTVAGHAVPVLWRGHRHLDAAALAREPRLLPVRLRAGHYGCQRDLILSPQHGVRVSGPDGDCLVRAGHLIGRGVRVVSGRRAVSYHHLLLPAHALIYAEGVQVESFYPGPMAVAALDAPDRKALLATIASLGDKGYGPRCLRLLTRKAAVALLQDFRVGGFAPEAATEVEKRAQLPGTIAHTSGPSVPFWAGNMAQSA